MNNSHFRNYLTENYYILGELGRRPRMDLKKYMATPVQEAPQDLYPNSDSDIEECGSCVDCQKPTSSICQKCDGHAYCQRCFEESHRVGRVMQQHKLESIQWDLSIKKCVEHSQNIADIYCRMCQKTICKDCFCHKIHAHDPIAVQVSYDVM